MATTNGVTITTAELEAEFVRARDAWLDVEHLSSDDPRYVEAQRRYTDAEYELEQAEARSVPDDLLYEWTAHPSSTVRSIAHGELNRRLEAAKPAPRLYWSRDGEAACAVHAPYRGSDTWQRDGWRALTAAELAEYVEVSGEPAMCHTAYFSPAAAADCGDRR